MRHKSNVMRRRAPRFVTHQLLMDELLIADCRCAALTNYELRITHHELRITFDV